jgi:thioesterase domain-containing protein
MNRTLLRSMKNNVLDPRMIVELRSGGDAAPLFCIHHSGGDVGIYRKLATRLKPGRPVIGIQSRLETDATEEFRSLDTMADGYADLITSRHNTGDIHLLGFSFGGFVATMIAERLRRAGRNVSFLGLIDSNLGWVEADQASRKELCLRLIQLFQKFQSVGVMNIKPMEQMQSDVAQLVDSCLGYEEVLPSEIMAKTLAMGYVAKSELHAELLGDFTFKFITHCRLLRGFKPTEIHVPMHLWWPSEAEASDPDAPRWEDSPNAGITQNTIAGTHYSMMRMPAARTLAAQIDAALDNVSLPESRYANLESIASNTCQPMHSRSDSLSRY